jgi:carbon monoxide dehydrogenase subunit G
MPTSPLTFGGTEFFSAPPEQLFAALTDIGQLSKTIPDLVSSEQIDQRTLKCVVRPGFSFLRGTLRLTISLGEFRPSESATMTVAAAGIGAQIRVTSELQIVPMNSGSQLNWSASVVELKGLVATISRPLISAAAEQVIQRAWQRFHAELDAPHA